MSSGEGSPDGHTPTKVFLTEKGNGPMRRSFRATLRLNLLPQHEADQVVLPPTRMGMKTYSRKAVPLKEAAAPEEQCTQQ